MITVACVWTGTKYGAEYVYRLRNMVRRNLSVSHRFVCFTDRAGDVPDGIEPVDVSEFSLPGWWAKMCLFRADLRGPGRTIYLDLDTVIVGSLDPLAEYAGGFAVCENFTRLAGHPTWPCRYGSCVMSFPDGLGGDIWDAFWSDRAKLMAENESGDQQVIEKLAPDATYLQSVMPPRFFLNKRDLPQHRSNPPQGTAVVVFGGSQRPHNCEIPWVQEAWR